MGNYLTGLKFCEIGGSYGANTQKIIFCYKQDAPTERFTNIPATIDGVYSCIDDTIYIRDTMRSQ